MLKDFSILYSVFMIKVFFLNLQILKTYKNIQNKDFEIGIKNNKKSSY